MKHFILMASLLMSTTVFAVGGHAPFLPEVDSRFDTIEDRATALEASVAGGTLASAKLLVGSAGNVATARTITGDVTIGNTGVTAIGAGKVLESMVTVANGKFLIGNASNVAVANTLSGDVTSTNTGVMAIGAGKVLETMLAVPTGTGLNAQRIAKAVYDCSVDCAIGAHTLGVTLPAKAIITRSFIQVNTQFADTGTCTIAISCEDANNIKTATDFGGVAASIVEGESTGAASAFKADIASACLITATTVDSSSCVVSTGKMTIFVEYVVGL